ncbi:Ankyrin repeat-containing protein 21 [Elsinoe fawcettii]|nr:Ankyrin repeat-containing protein 21 [Elsinoe fawcettii]
MSSTAPEHSQFTIGWICALVIEYIAAASFLDEEYDTVAPKAQNDNNDYTLGRIGSHNVVIAVCPIDEHGITTAATVSRDMVHTFPNVRVGLMVGIGGGLPSENHDIRLGDVVVSTAVPPLPAVLKFDRGRQKHDEFEITSLLNNPPMVFRTALAGLQAKHKRHGNGLLTMIDTALEKMDEELRNELTRPSLLDDILYKKDFVHTAQMSKQSTGPCCGGAYQSIVKRLPRASGKSVVVHYGPIGSADQVVKNAAERERLSQQLGLLCCEMEAGGLMNHWPCLVIRGVSDYADSHKNKQWQGHAAMTAAAYARCLLLRLAPTQIADFKTMSDILNAHQDVTRHAASIDEKTTDLIALHKESNERTTAYRADRSAKELDDEQRMCMRALGKHPYNEFKDRNIDRVAKTCEWALDSPEFQRWVNGEGGDILWITADPGCGKSVLAKSLVDHDIAELHAAPVYVCHFFFKDNDEQNSLAFALCSVLHQLFEQAPELLQHAIEQWRKYEDALTSKIDDLWAILIAACYAPAAAMVVCVFDALDECRNSGNHHDRLRFVRLLTRFYNSGPAQQRSRLKILATSRPYQDIEEEFSSAIQNLPELRLRGEDRNEDIAAEIDLVIDVRLDQLAQRRKLRSATQQRLRDVLRSRKNRTYLWLHIVLDYIDNEMRDALKPDQCIITSVPPTLDAAYQSILDKAPKKERATVRNIFKIVVAARRPLLIGEMAIALGIAIEPGERTIDEVRLDEDNLADRIRHLCGLFVFFDHSAIHLLHQTAKEFLLHQESSVGDVSRWWYFAAHEAEATMTYICARYLIIVSDIGDDVRQDKDRSMDPMLIYAAERWPGHYRSAGLRCDFLDASQLLRHLYSPGSKPQRWYRIQHQSRSGIDRHLPIRPRVNLAALYGHDSILALLLSAHREDVNGKDSDNRTALMVAAERSFPTTVKLLLENGADVNARDASHLTALHIAAREGHLKVVQLLLDGVDCDVNAQDDRGERALLKAARRGHVEMVQLLIAKGAKDTVRGHSYDSALKEAMQSKHLRAAKLLIDHAADHDVQTGYLECALLFAAERGYQELVKYVLDKGANVDARSYGAITALQYAARNGYKDVVQLLLHGNADIDAPGGNPWGCALQCAASRGHEEIVEILLDHGAIVDGPDRRGLLAKDYGSPLKAAVLCGHREVAKLLLERGANINARISAQGSVLSAAAVRWNKDLVSLLLSSGAHINPQSVSLLLDNGARINAQGGDYGNALQAAAANGDKEIVSLLLDNGADVNAQGGYYGNALQAAAALGRREVVGLLLENGADINAQGGQL